MTKNKVWPNFTFAFQPIVNVRNKTIISYEALVRGLNNEPASEILGSIYSADKYMFDEALRKQAITLATSLTNDCHLNLNLLPRCLESTSFEASSTLCSAKESGILLSNITLEIIESEIINDLENFIASINEYRAQGIHISIDDFGAGYSGLNLLAKFQPDSIKLDHTLINNIERIGPKQAIVRGILKTCLDLGIDVIAEGIETHDELSWCLEEGIDLYQGFLFAKPGFEGLPVVTYPK